MRRFLIALTILCAASCAQAQPTQTPEDHLLQTPAAPTGDTVTRWRPTRFCIDIPPLLETDKFFVSIHATGLSGPSALASDGQGGRRRVRHSISGQEARFLIETLNKMDFSGANKSLARRLLDKLEADGVIGSD